MQGYAGDGQQLAAGDASHGIGDGRNGGAVSRNGSRTGRRELRRRRGAQSGGRGNGGRRERAVGRNGGVGNGRRERRRDLLATWGHPAALGERPGGGVNGEWRARAGGSRRDSSPGGTDAGGAANRAGRRCRAGRAQGNARRRCESRLPGTAGRSVASASWGGGEPLGRGSRTARAFGSGAGVERGGRAQVLNSLFSTQSTQ